jgi:hypothetical protein
MREKCARRRLLVAALVVLAIGSPACATRECPPCRSLIVETAGTGDTTLPYTVEMEGPIRCDVVSAFGEPERLRCYCVDPTISTGPLATSGTAAE